MTIPTSDKVPLRTGLGSPERALKARRMAQCLAEYQSTQEPRLRDDIIREYSPLVHYLAVRLAHRGQPVEDLRQVGLMGLVKAIERYDPSLGANFRTYACPTIIGEMKRYMRDKMWFVKVPRRLLEMRSRVHRAVDRLTAETGRPPSPEEVAVRVGIDAETVLEVLDMEQCWAPKSLDSPGPSEETGARTTLSDTLTLPDASFIEVDHRMLISKAMQALTPRERIAILLRFFYGLTQTEIAARIHVSQMQVSRILRRALDALKTSMGTDGRSSN